MKLTKVLALPYAATKWPLTLTGRVLEPVLAGRVAEDDPWRLVIDAALGRAQELAGGLIGDPEEQRRGRARQDKVALLREAKARQMRADELHTEADREFTERREHADRVVTEARRGAQERREEAQQERAEGRERAQQTAQQVREQRRKEADAKAEQRRGGVHQTVQAAQEELDAEAEASRAERDAALDAARERRDGAEDARERAQTLGNLAERQKAARRTGS